MNYAACILFFMIGHMIRDGWPPLGYTHAARFCGGIWCLAGIGWLHWHIGLPELYLGASIWLGFYVDMKHGEGQGAATLSDASFLIISGITSLLPLATVEFNVYILYLGLVKVPIWFFWWWVEKRTFMQQKFWFLEPTRLAAITFGGCIGALVSSL